MSWIKNNLANLFTLGNLTLGSWAVVLVLQDHSLLAFWCMVGAAVLDFFDGFIARLTKTTSKIGADLDSLADMITFGLLPGAMAYSYLPQSVNFLALAVPVFSAWRLAVFNNDTRPASSFYGLPTPANALLIGGMYAEWVSTKMTLDGFFHSTGFHRFMLPITLLFSLLMVTNLRLLSNKISNFSLSRYLPHILVLALSILWTLTLGYIGITFGIISYVLVSIIANFALAKTQ